MLTTARSTSFATHMCLRTIASRRPFPSLPFPSLASHPFLQELIIADPINDTSDASLNDDAISVLFAYASNRWNILLGSPSWAAPTTCPTPEMTPSPSPTLGGRLRV